MREELRQLQCKIRRVERGDAENQERRKRGEELFEGRERNQGERGGEQETPGDGGV